MTDKVNTSRKAVGDEAAATALVLPLGSRTMMSATGIVLPVTVRVSFCPAVAVNVRTATSPIVPMVTVVGVPIAVVPTLFGTAFKVNVSVPTCVVARIDGDRVRSGDGQGEHVAEGRRRRGRQQGDWYYRLESRTMMSATGIVLPVTVRVSFCPAVAVNVRTATSPIVPIVTVVGVPIASCPRRPAPCSE